ncbi:hypothetical protein [Streptomyces sp. NPDC060001]|uniref:hypothetical protein n=1 Tax=Streptomyces sp. NPDC060001 TaxID=3347032 RepID=UPI0036AA330A
MTHISRAFDGGGHLEASCPCPLEPCGMVDRDKVDPACTQHPPTACRTMRSGHPAENCPGVGRDVVLAVGRTDKARQAVLDAACLEPEGFFNLSLLDALDEYRAAVEHEAAERIRESFEEAFEASQEVLSGTDAMLAADQIDPDARCGGPTTEEVARLDARVMELEERP